MVRKSVVPRNPGTAQAIEDVVEKARCEEGVERILIVYEGQAARVYVEKEAPLKKTNRT